MLTVLLGSISTVSAQSDSVYVFTPLEVQEIAYAIESRRILMLDTVDYKEKIKALRLKVSTIDEIVKRKDNILRSKDHYVDILEIDVNNLQLQVESLEKQNNKVIKQNKLLRIAVPISFSVGVALMLLAQ